MYGGTLRYFLLDCSCREKGKRGVHKENFWILGREMFSDRNRTWNNCIPTVKGMPKKMEGRKDMPKQQEKIFVAQGDFRDL